MRIRPGARDAFLLPRYARLPKKTFVPDGFVEQVAAEKRSNPPFGDASPAPNPRTCDRNDSKRSSLPAEMRSFAGPHFQSAANHRKLHWSRDACDDGRQFSLDLPRRDAGTLRSETSRRIQKCEPSRDEKRLVHTNAVAQTR